MRHNASIAATMIRDWSTSGDELADGVEYCFECGCTSEFRDGDRACASYAVAFRNFETPIA